MTARTMATTNLLMAVDDCCGVIISFVDYIAA